MEGIVNVILAGITTVIMVHLEVRFWWIYLSKDALTTPQEPPFDVTWQHSMMAALSHVVESLLQQGPGTGT